MSMPIFQTPFGQNSGQMPSDDAAAPMNGDVGTGGIRWISERHVACVFLLDTSGSMNANGAIDKLNAGLRTFKTQTLQDKTFDEHTKACIDVAIVSFGPDVKVHQEFTPVSEMTTPVLTADGGTPMGAALDKALDMIRAQKDRYNDLGTPYFRPWIFCITDGEPNDSYAAAVQRLKKSEEDKGVLGYCVGVESFNASTMAGIFNPERIFELKNLNFPALFKFVSNSLTTVRNSDPNGGRSVAVDAPADLHKISIAF